MSAASLSKFCGNFFSPHAPKSLVPQTESRDLIDHVGAYVGSAKGAWDVFRIVDYVVSFFSFLPNLSQTNKKLTEKICSVMNKTGVGFSIPIAITETVTLRNQLRHLKAVHLTPSSTPDRDKMIAQAYKQSLLGTMNLTSTLCQATMFLHDANLANFNKHLPVIDGVYNGASLVADTIDLVDLSRKLDRYKTELSEPQSENTRIRIYEKKNLAWMKVAKNVPSVIGAIVAIAALFFTACQTPTFAMIALGLNIAWLSMKLVSNIYERVITDRHAARRLPQPIAH